MTPRGDTDFSQREYLVASDTETMGEAITCSRQDVRGIAPTDRPSPILACWSGFATRRLPIPAGIPPGTRFAMQALTVMATPNGTEPTLSSGILATSR